MSVIESTDIKIYLSGGSENTDPNASLGGAISDTPMADNELHNLFAKVSASEAAAGSEKYRGVYVKNENGDTLTLEDAIAFIESQTTSGDTSIEISVATEDADATIQTIGNEDTAPTGQTEWVSATGVGEGQDVGDDADNKLDDGSYRGLWVKRIVQEGASAHGNDSASLGTRGETTATT